MLLRTGLNGPALPSETRHWASDLQAKAGVWLIRPNLSAYGLVRKFLTEGSQPAISYWAIHVQHQTGPSILNLVLCSLYPVSCTWYQVASVRITHTRCPCPTCWLHRRRLPRAGGRPPAAAEPRARPPAPCAHLRAAHLAAAALLCGAPPRRGGDDGGGAGGRRAARRDAAPL